MKHHLTLLAGVASLVLGAQAVQAQDAPEKDKPERRGGGGMNKERILERFDKDKNGALSKEEIADMPERMSKGLLEKWDKDKNGELSKEEVDAIKPPEGRERRERPKKEEGEKEKEEPKKEG